MTLHQATSTFIQMNVYVSDMFTVNLQTPTKKMGVRKCILPSLLHLSLQSSYFVLSFQPLFQKLQWAYFCLNVLHRDFSLQILNSYTTSHIYQEKTRKLLRHVGLQYRPQTPAYGPLQHLHRFNSKTENYKITKHATFIPLIRISI